MWIGIDFGTCYSSAAFLKDNIPTAVKFGVDIDRNLTSLPSSVYLDEQGKMHVGFAAENRRGRARHDPTRYRREFKRELGARGPLPLGNREMLPEHLVAEVLSALKVEAEKSQMRASGSLASVVLTIPASYKKQKKELMRGAAVNAGFTHIELLSEPVAAAIYYAWRTGAKLEGETTLVYDLGGGTFDAALIRKHDDSYESLAASVGHERLGGIDFDRMIGSHLLEQCSDAVRQSLKGRSGAAVDDDTRLNELRHRLVFADRCREMKEKLSWDTEAGTVFPQEPTTEYTLTRDELNQLIEPMIAETCEISRQLVESANLKWKDVNRVLLVGGSSRIPYVREAVERELKRPVVRADDPELAVCFGAAVHSLKLEEIAAKASRTSPPIAQGRRRGTKDSGDVLDLPAAAPDGKKAGGHTHSMESAYKALVEIAWADKKLNRLEVKKLEGLRMNLGLSDSQAKVVEVAVIGRSKEESLRRQEQAEKKAAEKKAAEEKAAEKEAADKLAQKLAAVSALKLSNRSKTVSEQDILQVLREWNLGSFYIDPNIPDRKLRNSRRCLLVPNDERILALLDITLLGSAKDAVVFSTKGLYYRGSFGTPMGSIPYAKFKDCTFEAATAGKVKAGNGVIIDIVGADTRSEVVAALLTDLQKLFSKFR